MQWLLALSVPVLLLFGSSASGSLPPCAAAPSTQEERPPTERELVNRSLGVLRAKKSTAPEREAAMDELLVLGTRGPQALAGHLEREIKRARRINAREESRVLSSFAKLAPALIEARLGRKELAEIEELRKVVLEAARDPGLTKETIETRSDPAMARLAALLTVTTDDVWDAHGELLAAHAALLDELASERYLIQYWESARDALAATEEGAGIAKRLSVPPRPTLDAAGIAAELERSARLATPMDDPDERAFVMNLGVADQMDPEESRGVHALNLRRLLLGLPVQTIDLKLCEACRGHSKDMREQGFFAHESPLEGRETPWKRAKLAGTTATSENIAQGATSGEAVILQWWYSPGHHRNMLGGGLRTGLGRSENTWTQLFGT